MLGGVSVLLFGRHEVDILSPLQQQEGGKTDVYILIHSCLKVNAV